MVRHYSDVHHYQDVSEELLEILWIAAEEEGGEIVRAPDLIDRWGVAPLDRLLAGGLVERSGEELRLTPTGRVEARLTVRRHRLAELLVTEVFNLEGEQADEYACQFEHLLRNGVDENVCRLLGHPRFCPHGKPIPAGDSCERARSEAEREVCPLGDLKGGETAHVAYLASRDARQLQKLMAIGVLPGAEVTLLRKFPSVVFRLGHSEFAVDAALAEEIRVRRGEAGRA
ncbi:MAG: metal-dependent transcriptional regulator [Planctomycetota bacterium]